MCTCVCDGKLSIPYTQKLWGAGRDSCRGAVAQMNGACRVTAALAVG
jgi:hypothetical protein